MQAFCELSLIIFSSPMSWRPVVCSCTRTRWLRMCTCSPGMLEKQLFFSSIDFPQIKPCSEASRCDTAVQHLADTNTGSFKKGGVCSQIWCYMQFVWVVQCCLRHLNGLGNWFCFSKPRITGDSCIRLVHMLICTSWELSCKTCINKIQINILVYFSSLFLFSSLMIFVLRVLHRLNLVGFTMKWSKSVQ